MTRLCSTIADVLDHMIGYHYIEAAVVEGKFNTIDFPEIITILLDPIVAHVDCTDLASYACIGGKPVCDTA